MANASGTLDIHVEPVTSSTHFREMFGCQSEAFGRQTADAIWIAMNPNWQTEQGQVEGAESIEKRWKGITQNKRGEPNTVILRAYVKDPQSGKESTAGMCIWQQASFVPGWGDEPSLHLKDEDVELIKDEKERRFARQLFASMWQRRVQVARVKAEEWEAAGQPDRPEEIPAIFVLDICAVHPNFQRRGVAQKLVAWGLEEAQRRGGLECTTEASAMGRGAYMKLGFKPEGSEDIFYVVDEEFAGRDKPSNVFLRTGGVQE